MTHEPTHEFSSNQYGQPSRHDVDDDHFGTDIDIGAASIGGAGGAGTTTRSTSAHAPSVRRRWTALLILVTSLFAVVWIVGIVVRTTGTERLGPAETPTTVPVTEPVAEPGSVCAQGFELVGSQCLSYTSPTRTHLNCPERAPLHADGTCRQPLDCLPIEQQCLGQVRGIVCITPTEPVPLETCPSGAVLVTDLGCVVATPLAEGESCPAEAVGETRSECLTPVAANVRIGCPPGSLSVDNNPDACVVHTVMARQCPAGASVAVDGTCFRRVTQLPSSTVCLRGTLQGHQCVTVGPPPS